MLKNNADDWDFVVRGNSWRLILLNHPHSKMCQTQFLRIRSSIEIQDTHSQQKSHFQKIYRPHQNLICSCNFLQPNHGLRTPRESFFSKIPKPHSKLCQTQFLRIRSSIEIQDIHSQQKSHFQKIYRPHQNLICSCNFLQPNHGLRTPRESFFSKIPKPHSKLCQTQFLRIRSSIEIQDIHSQQKSHLQKIYRPHQNLIF